MSISKNDKYGVPVDTSRDIRAGLTQPKFNSRFRVFLIDFGEIRKPPSENPENAQTEYVDPLARNIITSMAESFTRPTLNFGTQEATSFIGRSKYSGRMKHENFSMVIRDDITNSVISKVYAQAKKQTYKFHPITQDLQKSPYLGIDTKFICILQIMDGRTNHKSLETWTFYGCTIDSIENVANSYDDGAGIAKLTLNCSFDFFDISQEERLVLPTSYNYDENGNSGDGRGTNTPNGALGAENDIFDNIGNAASSVIDSGTELFSKAKDTAYRAFGDDDNSLF